MKMQWRKGPGQLLLTETSLFAFLSTADAVRFGGAIAGLLGALIGYLIDSRNARLYSPLHMDDPEIQGLGTSVQKSLRKSTILVKMPIAGLTARPTKLGFVFESEGLPIVSYTGWLHKKSIRGFLHEHRVTIIDA